MARRKQGAVYEEEKNPKREDRYVDQTIHDFDWKGIIKQVPVWIVNPAGDLQAWMPHIEYAIQAINKAAPGLVLFPVEKSQNVSPNIEISATTELESYTDGSIVCDKTAEIKLTNSIVSDDHRQATALHELMHALGFEHEHQRKDANKFLKVPENSPDHYKPEEKIKGITPFDPQSIMMYSEFKYMNRNGHTLWKLKPNPKQQNIILSELDKVGLNMLYPPCKKYEYNPKIGTTGFYYCSRIFTDRCEYPCTFITDGVCGPNIGPNCPACRTLITPAFNGIKRDDKFQGMSGLVYCNELRNEGNLYGHDEYCGSIGNGLPCRECRKILHV